VALSKLYVVLVFALLFFAVAKAAHFSTFYFALSSEHIRAYLQNTFFFLSVYSYDCFLMFLCVLLYDFYNK